MNNHETLTALLTAHPEVERQLFSVRAAHRWLYPLSYDNDVTTKKRVICFLERAADSYFSSALARVADAGYAFSMHYDRPKKQFEYQMFGDGRGEAWFGWGASRREALIALWLALLAVVVKPCEHCAAGRVQDVLTKKKKDCDFCHGTGLNTGLLDALVGEGVE